MSSKHHPFILNKVYNDTAKTNVRNNCNKRTEAAAAAAASAPINRKKCFIFLRCFCKHDKRHSLPSRSHAFKYTQPVPEQWDAMWRANGQTVYNTVLNTPIIYIRRTALVRSVCRLDWLCVSTGSFLGASLSSYTFTKVRTLFYTYMCIWRSIEGEYPVRISVRAINGTWLGKHTNHSRIRNDRTAGQMMNHSWFLLAALSGRSCGQCALWTFAVDRLWIGGYPIYGLYVIFSLSLWLQQYLRMPQSYTYRICIYSARVIFLHLKDVKSNKDHEPRVLITHMAAASWITIW